MKNMLIIKYMITYVKIQHNASLPVAGFANGAEIVRMVSSPDYSQFLKYLILDAPRHKGFQMASAYIAIMSFAIELNPEQQFLNGPGYFTSEF